MDDGGYDTEGMCTVLASGASDPGMSQVSRKGRRPRPGMPYRFCHAPHLVARMVANGLLAWLKADPEE